VIKINREDKVMDVARYNLLMAEQEKLTQKEIDDGWRFCCEWDGLLVNKNDKEGEGQFCTCK